MKDEEKRKSGKWGYYQGRFRDKWRGLGPSCNSLKEGRELKAKNVWNILVCDKFVGRKNIPKIMLDIDRNML
ncbi:MAG: hypothetical protein FVQ82_02580 [Planctomycetes bacterium]|nr:hypothetical protein [Planctomycetota bacterium]